MTPRVGLLALIVVCTASCATVPCRAAVIPRAETAVSAAEASATATKKDVAEAAVSSLPPPALTSEAFRVPQPTSAGPGAATTTVSTTAMGAVRPGARGLAAPGAEPALHADHALAHAADMDPERALEPAPALLRDAGAGQQPGLHQQLGVASSTPRGADGANKADVTLDEKDKGALVQAILTELAGGSPAQEENADLMPPTTTAAPTTLELPAPPSHPLGQVKPAKQPRFSDSLLPGLVQVLNYVVDLVEEREQVVEVAPTTTTTSAPYVMETVQIPPASQVVTIESPSKPPPPGTDTDQIILSGSLSSIASLLTAVAQNIPGNLGTASVSITDTAGAPAKAVADAAVTEPATEPIMGNDAFTEEITELVIEAVTEPNVYFESKEIAETATEAAAKTVNAATTTEVTESTTELAPKDAIKNRVKEVVKGAVGEVVVDAVKGVVQEAIREIFQNKEIVQNDEPAVKAVALSLDDEDMQEDMPVVQRDVPVVNEETVPMTMMMSMVMDDAGPLSFDMSPPEVEYDDEVDFSRTRRAADIFPDEFKTYVTMPSEDRQDDEEDDVETSTEHSDVEKSTEHSDVGDEAMLALPQYRGEVAAVGNKSTASAASQSLLSLVKLRFALSAEAKRQNLKRYNGFSEKVLAALVKTSTLNAREQLGVLLAGVLDQNGIKSPRTKKRATAVLDELENVESDLSKALEDLPALKYSA